MQSHAKKDHYFRAASVFLACLASVFAGPFIAIYAHSVLPSGLTNFLFFGPQLLFPYESLVVRSPNNSRLVFSHSVGLILTFVHWGIVTGLFAWAARRSTLRYTIPSAVATILVVGVAMHVAFGVFGVSVELDGP